MLLVAVLETRTLITLRNVDHEHLFSDARLVPKLDKQGLLSFGAVDLVVDELVGRKLNFGQAADLGQRV